MSLALCGGFSCVSGGRAVPPRPPPQRAQGAPPTKRAATGVHACHSVLLLPARA